jgi:peptidoglycan-associated lipoprotein
MKTVSRLILLAAALVPASACRRSPAPTPIPQPTVERPAVDDGDAERARLDSIRRAEGARADSAARADSLRRERAEATSTALAALRETVFFDYDADGIRSDATVTLDAKAAALRAYPAVRIRVEGHTDERGSDEYNLALGQRRAAAVKRYLMARGVEDHRIDTESLGEQRPICTSSESESCWQENRRAAFAIVAGVETVGGSA